MLQQGYGVGKDAGRGGKLMILMIDNYDSKTKPKKQQGAFILDGSGIDN